MPEWIRLHGAKSSAVFSVRVSMILAFGTDDEGRPFFTMANGESIAVRETEGEIRKLLGLREPVGS